MQDKRSIGNGVGSLLGGGGRGGQPHLKPNYHQGSLKCPRCGSFNTKFCYYNNYNLSQPRFFCKGCHRYWTKGGVLRNVPVGGGSHKTKHSKQKSGDGNPSSVSVASARQRKSTNSQKSSNISPEMPPSTLIEPVPTLFNQSFEPPMLTDKQFSEMGGFRSLMTSPSDELPPMTSWLTQQRDQDQIAAEDGGLFDQSYWLNNPDHQFSYFR